MKIAGRKTSGAYELYGFIPRVENGKHSAICMSCNRVLQNTAAVRLQKHRNSCLATRSISSDPAHLSNVQMKRRIPTKTVAIQQYESINSNVKTELTDQCKMEYDDLAGNNNTVYEDTLETTYSSRRLHKNTQNDQVNVFSVTHKSLQHCNSLDHEETPIQSPVSIQQQPPEPFEIYHTTANSTNSSPLAVCDEIHEVSDEDLVNIEEFGVIQNLMPRSKESKQLQDELAEAEAEYYRYKAAYFTKLSDNCKIKRTLMLLESRKLQLEIEKLTNECS